ncbi:MAG: hypothetical protein QXD77_00170, partial [Candidatus Aenigmatarchaeota archaeon]
FRWSGHIDNLASFRDGTLLFDIERHFCRGISGIGKIVQTRPKYAFMIDHCGATEKTLLGRKPLAARTFHLAARVLPGYRLEKETCTRIRYAHPAKNYFCAWDDCVSFGTEKAGTMVGLIQKEPVNSLNELLKKTLPEAITDWNALAKKLELRHIDNRLLTKLIKQAVNKDKSYPKSDCISTWPKNPSRFWFEQE